MLSLLLLLVGSWTSVQAQTFADYPLSYGNTGVSPGCLTALNSTITCTGILAINAEDLPRLSASDLTSLCKSTCLSSLESTRTKIAAACSLSTDTMEVHDVVYPATYLIDYFLYAYRLFCRVDPTTKKFCDVLQAEWKAANTFTRTQTCSDCALGQLQLQLNSPFGYHEEVASDFAALTSSCSKTGYAVTPPPPYSVPTASLPSGVETAPPMPTGATVSSSCVTLYKVQSQDTCNSIAAANKVSTFAVYGPNGLNCDKLPSGQTICLLGSCETYQVKAGDTCDSIIKNSGKTIEPDLFVAWNPNINLLCSDIEKLIGSQICLSRPEGILNPIAVGSPTVNQTVPTALPTRTFTEGPPLPTASGTISGCTSFMNYTDLEVGRSQLIQLFPGSQTTFDSTGLNTCSFVAADNSIILSDFLRWNPSLKSGPGCVLSRGFNYCVNHASKTPPTPPDDSLDCLTVDPSIIPAGTTSSCTCFIEYQGFFQDSYLCEDVALWSKTSVANLQLWNPWLGSSCNLYANFPNESARRAICVRGPGGSVSTTTSSSAVPSSSGTSGSTSGTSTSSRTSSAVGSSSYKTSSPTTTTSKIPSTTTTTTTSPPVPSSPGSVCVSGKGEGNYMGLCDFCCGWGYCPPGPCTCLAYGNGAPPPAATWPPGYPAPGLDASYTGLCSFACNHGYCPPGVCTTTRP